MSQGGGGGAGIDLPQLAMDSTQQELQSPPSSQSLSRSIFSTLGLDPMVQPLSAGDEMLARHEQAEALGDGTWDAADGGEVAMLDLDEADDDDVVGDGNAHGSVLRVGDAPPGMPETQALVNRHDHPRAGCCGRARVDEPPQPKPVHLLGQWTASAISGNDITSSILYMGGLCITKAGPFAPISILLVVWLLYLFRSVYAEVVTALPLNGGAYNALLNTTTKIVAAIGGTLTVLSYVATAVVSADSAVQYFHSLVPSVPPFWLPVGVLALFALLNLVGISESSVVALVIFTFHCTVLTILTVVSFVYCVSQGFPMFVANWQPDVYLFFGTPAQNIAFGFGVALVGVSGFESSANYVEEQEPGVFRKTLRNMWLVVSFFNPVLTILAISMLDVHEVARRVADDCKVDCDPLLSQMAQVAGGKWLHLIIGLDASLVLAGAVLTSYVGVGGLMRRMALDRCFPQFLLMRNPITKTNHFIIGIFFFTTSSLYLLVRGDITTLTGVYSVAFLCVMALFAGSNMLLKYKRSKLAREVLRSTWLGVICALSGVVAGLILNIVDKTSIVLYFVIYFIVFLMLSMIMFVRVRVMRIAINLLKNTRMCKGPCGARVKKYVKELNSQTVVFFTKEGRLSVLNKAITYIRDNELTDNVVVVHVWGDNDGDPQGTAPRDEQLREKLHRIRTNCRILDRQYPKATVSLLFVQGTFNAETVARVSDRLQIPRNFMFIASPTAAFQVKLGELGGVRLITH